MGKLGFTRCKTVETVQQVVIHCSEHNEERNRVSEAGMDWSLSGIIGTNRN